MNKINQLIMESLNSDRNKVFTKILTESNSNPGLDELVDIANELDWSCSIDENGIEFEKHSPLGEDFIFYAEGTTPEEICDSVYDYDQGFDAEEHAEIWIENRGKNGTPNSIRDLLDDAEAIQGMLDELQEALDTKYRGRKSIGEIVKDEELTESKGYNVGYIYNVLNFLNNTRPGGIEDGETRVLADYLYNQITGKGKLPVSESEFIVSDENLNRLNDAILDDNQGEFLTALMKVVRDNSRQLTESQLDDELINKIKQIDTTDNEYQKIVDNILDAYDKKDLKTSYNYWTKMYDRLDSKLNKYKENDDKNRFTQYHIFNAYMDKIPDQAVYDITDYGKREYYRHNPRG